MNLSLGFSSRGFWVRYFMESGFLLVPTPQSQTVCHICLLCPFQSYLVSDGPSGSLSHPPPPGPRIPLSWPPMLLGRMQCMYQETQGTHSLQPFWDSPWVGLQTVCLELPWLGTFAVELSVLSPWRLSVDASAETAVVRGWFPFRLVWSPCCIKDSQVSSQAPQFKSSILWHSLFLMVQITHLYLITGKTIALTLQTSVAKWVFTF